MELTTEVEVRRAPGEVFDFHSGTDQAVAYQDRSPFSGGKRVLVDHLLPRRQTIARVVLPAILPAILTGAALAFARAVGEYGSVIFIAGNLPMKTEITPLLIVIKLEQFDYAGAAALGFMMLVLSFIMLLSINLLQTWGRRRQVVAGR